MRMSFGRGILYWTASSLLVALSGYVTRIWLGQHLGPADYGVYSVVISFNTALGIVAIAGIPRAVSKYVAEDNRNIAPVFRSGMIAQFVSSLGVTALLVAFADPLAASLNDRSMAPHFRLSALYIVPYALLVFYWGYHNGLRSFGRSAATSAIYSISRAVLLIGLAYAFGLYGAILGVVLSPLVALPWVLGRPPSGPGRFSYRRLLTFSIPLLALAILSTLQQSVDLWLVKALLPAETDAGYYAAGQDVARVLFFALSGVQPVLFPAISGSVGAGTLPRTQMLIRQSLRVSLILMAPGALLISATSGAVLELLYSERYLPAAGALSILAPGFGFVTLFSVLTTVLSGAGRPGFSALLAAVSLVLTAGMSVLLVPNVGLEGAALATTVGGGVAAGAAALAIYRQFGALVSVRSVLRITVAALGVYLLARVVPVTPALLPVWYIALLALYVLIMVGIGEFRREDWSRIQDASPVRIPFFSASRRGA
jgi:O-antigen/teichoic acid export membrane protein